MMQATKIALASSLAISLALTSSVADRCILGASSLSSREDVEGWRFRYSAMNTRKIRFHLRIVGMSSADASSYNTPKSAQLSNITNGTHAPAAYATPLETGSQ